MLLNGATIIDGPELIWSDDFGETWGGVKDSEGYSCRNWYTKDQYVNPTHIWHYVTDGDHGGKTIRPHMYNFVRNIFKA